MVVAYAIIGKEGKDNSAVWACQVQTDGPTVFLSVLDARIFLEKHCPKLLYYMSESALAKFSKATSFPTGKSQICTKFHSGRVVLVGDAAAAFPIIGQGGNAGMESSIVLDQCLAKYNNVFDAIREYTNLWRPQAFAVKEIALKLDMKHNNENFGSIDLAKREDLTYLEALYLEAKKANAKL